MSEEEIKIECSNDVFKYTPDQTYDYIYELQQENQQLKEEIKELELHVGLRQKRNLISKFDKEYDLEDKKKNPNRTYACIMPDAEEVYKRYYDYKERIEKAIEYANQSIKYPVSLNSYKLLEILKGDKDDR